MESNRRQFLKATAAVTALSQSRVLGANNRIRLGAIGTGHRCRYLLQVVNKVGDADILAVCDAYRPNAEEAKEQSAPHASTYADYRKVLDRKDLDAVVIGAPDHWHVHMLHDALAAGKDVYIEKPLTHSIAEGERVMRTMNDTKQVVQVGMQLASFQRSERPDRSRAARPDHARRDVLVSGLPALHSSVSGDRPIAARLEKLARLRSRAAV